jgi:hypothetical protein
LAAREAGVAGSRGPQHRRAPTKRLAPSALSQTAVRTLVRARDPGPGRCPWVRCAWGSDLGAIRRAVGRPLGSLRAPPDGRKDATHGAPASPESTETRARHDLELSRSSRSPPRPPERPSLEPRPQPARGRPVLPARGLRRRQRKRPDRSLRQCRAPAAKQARAASGQREPRSPPKERARPRPSRRRPAGAQALPGGLENRQPRQPR